LDFYPNNILDKLIALSSFIRFSSDSWVEGLSEENVEGEMSVSWWLHGPWSPSRGHGYGCTHASTFAYGPNRQRKQGRVPQNL